MSGAKLQAVVAVPARDEESHIGACLGALAAQQDGEGHALPSRCFGVVVLLNNCRDGTAAVMQSLAPSLPFPLRMIECELPQALAHAGGARRRAMDAAADWLEANCGAGLLLTTDADSRVGSRWIAANLAASSAGADAVAGRITLDPQDASHLPSGLHARGRLESTYVDQLTEISAILDPRSHNPWPHHATASGASLAVTLATYRRIGGLPQLPLGEDRGLVAALEAHDARIRFAPEIEVVTSGRLVGRASGGVADTIRLRCDDADAPCDAMLEPADTAIRRAHWRGRLRRLHRDASISCDESWAGEMCVPPGEASLACRSAPFGAIWRRIEEMSPLLERRSLRPSQLPSEIDRAAAALTRLRRERAAFKEVETILSRPPRHDDAGKM